MARPVREVVVGSLFGQTIPPAPHDIPPIVQTASFVRCPSFSRIVTGSVNPHIYGAKGKDS
jgi:hypothetical protein